MSYKFYQNKDCEFFPCHKGIIKEEFNCLFCYCPLYLLGKDCGGNFTYIDNCIKDCSLCTLPHVKDLGFDFVVNKINDMNKNKKI